MLSGNEVEAAVQWTVNGGAAWTSFQGSLSYVTFLFSECRINWVKIAHSFLPVMSKLFNFISAFLGISTSEGKNNFFSLPNNCWNAVLSGLSQVRW